MRNQGIYDLDASKETVIDAISGELIELDEPGI